MLAKLPYEESIANGDELFKNGFIVEAIETYKAVIEGDYQIDFQI
jgi:hypothetical protein